MHRYIPHGVQYLCERSEQIYVNFMKWCQNNKKLKDKHTLTRSFIFHRVSGEQGEFDTRDVQLVASLNTMLIITENKDENVFVFKCFSVNVIKVILLFTEWI